MGLLDQRLGVAHEAREQPDDRLGDREGGDLAAVEDVVAERDLAHRAERGGVLDDPLVDALVAAAREDQVLVRAQLVGELLGERLTAGRGEDDRGVSLRPTGVERAAPQGSGFMTIPAPPPYGVSSTVWWRSVVQSRRSWTVTSSRPLARALPGRLRSSGAR